MHKYVVDTFFQGGVTEYIFKITNIPNTFIYLTFDPSLPAWKLSKPGFRQGVFAQGIGIPQAESTQYSVFI